jgi:hypothetical protein
MVQYAIERDQWSHVPGGETSRQKFQMLDRFQMLERRPEQEQKILRPEQKVPELEWGFP